MYIPLYSGLAVRSALPLPALSSKTQKQKQLAVVNREAREVVRSVRIPTREYGAHALDVFTRFPETRTRRMLDRYLAMRRETREEKV